MFIIDQIDKKITDQIFQFKRKKTTTTKTGQLPPIFRKI